MIAALFVRHDSVYKQISGVDAWDAERDAMRWPELSEQILGALLEMRLDGDVTA